MLISLGDWCLTVVQAVNVVGVGPFSEAVLCQTPCSVPAAVSNIYTMRESELQRYETPVEADEDEEEEDRSPRPAPLYSPSTCLGICWESPCDHGSEITSYLIDLGERQPITVGPITKYIIQNLQPDTSYRLVLSSETPERFRKCFIWLRTIHISAILNLFVICEGSQSFIWNLWWP